MTPVEIIQTLERRGVTLNLSGENLEVTGISKLTETEIATLKGHKRAFVRALKRRCDKKPSPPKRLYPGAGVPVDAMGLPFRPCSKLKGPGPDKQECGGLHFWKDVDVWRCSECYGMPIRFFGETCIVAREE